LRAPPVSAVAHNRRERLRQLQIERGLRGPVELGKLIGRKVNQTSDLLIGRAAFGERLARSIEEHAGLPPGWLDEPPQPLVAPTPTAGGGGHEPEILVEWLPGAPHGGRLAWSTPVRLAPSWVAQLDLAEGPQQLRLWPVDDDSMEPTLTAGDLLLLDAGVHAASRDGIYAVHLGGSWQLRRVRLRPGGALELSADHPALRSVDVVEPQMLEVAARALWCWRGRKL